MTCGISWKLDCSFMMGGDTIYTPRFYAARRTYGPLSLADPMSSSSKPKTAVASELTADLAS